MSDLNIIYIRQVCVSAQVLSRTEFRSLNLYVTQSRSPRASFVQNTKSPFFFFSLLFLLLLINNSKEMGAQAVDYRVSTLIVLCKDCGQDVGLYPARHKCGPIERPAMPTLPTQYQKSPPPLQLNARTISSGSSSSTTSSSTSPSFTSVEQTPSKWSSRLAKSSAHQDQTETEESIYFNNFASNLPENHDQPPSGKKLWGKVKQNEKWKQLGEKSN